MTKKTWDPILALANWYQANALPHPWRNKIPDAYAVWVSEIMLQQTQIKTVIPYFNRWMRAFSTVEKLARASETQVLHLWQGLGYYSRARNLHRAAKEIVNLGEFPKTASQWRELPGVGPYTAGAISSIAFDEVEAAVDGNIERVFSRILRDGVRDPKNLRGWKWAGRLVKSAHKKKVRPSDWNQALMELGERVCTPKNPSCGICPISKICRAYREGDVHCYPAQKKKAERLSVEEAREMWIHPKSEKVFLVKAGVGEWRAGLWDLPKNSLKKIDKKTIGEVFTEHVVTRHQIKRTTQVAYAKKPDSLEKEMSGKWVSYPHKNFPTGSAFKATWKEALRQGFLRDPKTSRAPKGNRSE